MESSTNKSFPNDKSQKNSTPWKVMLYDDNHSNVTHVAYHLQHAIATSSSRAVQLALAAHHNGEVAIYKGPFFDCQEIADDLREFGLTVEIVG